MDELKFEINEVTSDQFALTVFRQVSGVRLDVLTLHIGPGEYSELTTALINFGA